MSHVVLAETGEKIAVGKIVAVGANYADHVREMKMTQPKSPIIFLKPPTSIIHEGQPVVFPSFGALLHHEVELGLVIRERCKDVPQAEAGTCVLGYLLALDLTLRDLQAEAKKNGKPWSVAKGFDCSCPVSAVVGLEDLSEVGALRLGLSVNGETRQNGSTAQMVWKPDELVSIASTFFTLERGDLLLTGTPSGVGPVERGDSIHAWLGSELAVDFEVE